MRLRGRLRLERWDPHTGRIGHQEADLDANISSVLLELPPVSSVFLVGENLADGNTTTVIER